MDEKVLNLLMDKPVVVPKILLSNYRKLNITEEELVIIIAIIYRGNKIVYDPISIANDINMDKLKIMEIVSNLIEKNILTSITIKKNNKKEEYLSLELLYSKLVNLVLDVKPEVSSTVKYSVFEKFEEELGKTLSSMQYEQIKEWLNSGVSEEIIIEALREMVLNGINNFNYIDKIINTWTDKGYKTKEDIIKAKREYHKKEKVSDVFDTDWLNDD